MIILFFLFIIIEIDKSIRTRHYQNQIYNLVSEDFQHNHLIKIKDII